jgi:hypothetical protein
MTDYTLDDHAKAAQNLAHLQEKWENYSGNNPNKYRAEIEVAKAALTRIERALKEAGLMARTAQEQRDAALDAAFPNAFTRQIVEWEGQRFQKCYTPIATSLSGKTVREWKGFWTQLTD